MITDITEESFISLFNDYKINRFDFIGEYCLLNKFNILIDHLLYINNNQLIIVVYDEINNKYKNLKLKDLETNDINYIYAMLYHYKTFETTQFIN